MTNNTDSSKGGRLGDSKSPLIASKSEQVKSFTYVQSKPLEEIIMNPPQPDITRTIEEILESYAKYQYQLHVDNDGTIQLNKREAVHKLTTLVNKAKIDELKSFFPDGTFNPHETIRAVEINHRIEQLTKELT